MRVYVEAGFLNHFLSLSGVKSKEVQILWNIINSYAEVIWVFNNSVSYEDFEKWETSNGFYTIISSKASNGIELKKDFKTEINAFEGHAQILLAEKKEAWHISFSDHAVVLTINEFEKTLKDIATKFTFKFIADQNNSWDEFENLKTNLVSTITLTDKYILSPYLDKNNIKKLDNNFIFLINKITHSKGVHLKILIKSYDLDRGKYEVVKNKLTELSSYLKEHLHPNLKITVVNAELDGDYDFHDRNIITPYYIVKGGKGFERVSRKSVNTEVECYSFLDKWGYDLIRHRQQMINKYEASIANLDIPFTSSTI